jgi:hypothetical protein
LPVRTRADCLADLPAAADRGMLDESLYKRVAVVFVLAALASLCLLFIAGDAATTLPALGIGFAVLSVLPVVFAVRFAALHGQFVRATADGSALRTLLRRRTVPFADVSKVAWQKRGRSFVYVLKAGAQTFNLSPKLSTLPELVRLSEIRTGLRAEHAPIVLPVQAERPRVAVRAVIPWMLCALCAITLVPVIAITPQEGWIMILPVAAGIGLVSIFGIIALWLTWNRPNCAVFEEDGITVKTWFAPERIEPADITSLQLADGAIRITLPDKTVFITTRNLPWPPVVFCEFLRAQYGAREYPREADNEHSGGTSGADVQPV